MMATKVLYNVTVGDFDMREQSYTHDADAEMTRDEIETLKKTVLNVNKRAAYCTVKKKGRKKA